MSILHRTALLIGKKSWDIISMIIAVYTNLCYLFLDCNFISCLINFLFSYTNITRNQIINNYVLQNCLILVLIAYADTCLVIFRLTKWQGWLWEVEHARLWSLFSVHPHWLAAVADHIGSLAPPFLQNQFCKVWRTLKCFSALS